MSCLLPLVATCFATDQTTNTLIYRAAAAATRWLSTHGSSIAGAVESPECLAVFPLLLRPFLRCGTQDKIANGQPKNGLFTATPISTKARRSSEKGFHDDPSGLIQRGCFRTAPLSGDPRLGRSGTVFTGFYAIQLGPPALSSTQSIVTTWRNRDCERLTTLDVVC
ncbi:hypothetical protein F4778DRAFT_544018 [Xylariomycetidae sp. FL2044]|nr:hypothetical protein F4778DRAFT_544018 [Xylariomycetidae sp. FL2044]